MYAFTMYFCNGIFICCVLDRLAVKIARKDSLALKLSLRPDRDELIARNIIRVVSEKEQQESKEAIGAKLIRYGDVGTDLKILRALHNILVSPAILIRNEVVVFHWQISMNTK
jgi:hypothetical protein